MKKFNFTSTFIAIIVFFVLINPFTLFSQENPSVKLEPTIPAPKLEKKANPYYLTLTFESELSKEDMFLLDSISDYLTKNPSFRVQITGHSDNVGTLKDVEQRAQEKIEKVVKYLSKKGIKRSRMLDINQSSRLPLTDNRTPEGRKTNQRVEIKVLKEYSIKK